MNYGYPRRPVENEEGWLDWYYEARDKWEKREKDKLRKKKKKQGNKKQAKNMSQSG